MYSAEEFLKKNSIELQKINYKNKNKEAASSRFFDDDLQEVNFQQEYDKNKSKVLKYVLYKKRTEQEIRQKFAKDLDENILNDIIEELKDNLYIDDYNYIEKTVNEYIKLKKLSIKELKYKLLSKGLKSNLIEDYFSKNIDILNDFEETSACQIVNKKRNIMEDEEIRLFLLKKGYKEESIKKSFLNE